jgi:hypothetical protein
MLSNPKLNSCTFLLPQEVHTPPESNLREVRTLPMCILRTCLGSSHPASVFAFELAYEVRTVLHCRVRGVRTLLVYLPVRMPNEVHILPLSRVRESLFLKMSIVFSTRVCTLLEMGPVRIQFCSHLTSVALWL